MREPVVNEVLIHRDAEGRYSLNALHRASGRATRHRPAAWLASRQAMELISELTTPIEGFGTKEDRPLRAHHSGPVPGPYAGRDLLLAYALWISPAFYKKVSQALADDELEELRPPRFLMAPRALPRETQEAALTVVGVGVRRDAEGRFCLNDLHRAAGDSVKHRPANWLQNKQTQKLVAEIAGNHTKGIPVVKKIAGNHTNGIPVVNENPVVTIEGKGGGTYVCKELVYCYAMWISPAFHLKVIRAYDALVSQPAAAPAELTRMQLIDMARQAEQERLQLAHQVEELAPKAQALERIADSEGLFSVTAAAKMLAVRPKALFAWLQEHRWIYRRAGSARWLAYQPRIQAGHLEHKVFTVTGADGQERSEAQVLVTPKGLARIAALLSQPSKEGNGSG
jgi:phage antirepressor YoqD-like protein